MRVRIEYKNKDLEIVGYDVFDLDLYSQKLSQDIIGVLNDIEKCLTINNIDFDLDESFRYVRHKLLDLAGSIKRLPDNLIDEKSYSKPTKRDLISAVNGG